MPETAIVCATPGVSRAIFSISAIGFLVRRKRRRIGQLDVDDQPALVLLRDEARGCSSEHPIRQHQQPGVDQQHQQLARSSQPTVQA